MAASSAAVVAGQAVRDAGERGVGAELTAGAAGRTTPSPAPVLVVPGLRLTAAEADELEEAVDRTIDDVVAAQLAAAAGAGTAEASGEAYARDAGILGNGSVLANARAGVVRALRGDAHRTAEGDAELERRREEVRRELLLQGPRLW
ncbi:hypothetical protein [Sinomonas halotolerans]|uniref:Uncharacterized protein n=1 Tax=Sinomonas halotolerans TaxID=1644133 RepID=A0ABU9WZ55_9MICC